MKASHILGINARNHLYLSRYNSRRGKALADSKLLTKRALARLKIPHPRLITKFERPADVARFDWSQLSDNFVIKPAAGYAGEGIVIIRQRIIHKEEGKRQKDKGQTETRSSPSGLFPSSRSGLSPSWSKTFFFHPSIAPQYQLMDGSRVSLSDLRLHILDILAGRYDKFNLPGVAMIEERVIKHPKFRRYAFRGTPDVRIVIFNSVPVMAMLRLPTPESRGRANLHQGAIGVGIDLATGITTQAVRWDRPIYRVPAVPAENRAMRREQTRLAESAKRVVRAAGERQAKAGGNLKLNGIQIPFWDRLMELAVEIQHQVPLGYLAVDFLLDPEKGPLVVELTARPGLGIQIANLSGLQRRIERVEGLDVTPGRGIQVARSLFGERFADKILAERGVKVVGVFEMVRVKGADGRKMELSGKIDTGAYRSSIDRLMAQRLGLLKRRSILWHDYYVSTLGREQRPVIPLTLWLSGRKIETTANVSDRGKMKEKVLIGRRDLGTFVVKPGEG